MKRNLLLQRFLRGALVLAFWLAVWQTVSLCAPRFLFASPLDTLTALIRLTGQAPFWLSIAHTLCLTALGFSLAFVLGNAFAVLCYGNALLRALAGPAIQVMKSVPVACFIVVSLIWIPSAYLSVLVSFFVVFPVSYVSLQAGLSGLRRPLMEMMQVFRVPLGKRVRMVYLPQLLPDVLAGCRVSAGMCWKASIAGEIIGLPLHSVGEQLYLAKLYLSTDELFAWTLVIIAISLLFEKLLVRVLHAVQRKLEVYHENSV